MKSSGPSGNTMPSSPSSSLPPVMQLETLGLAIDMDELGADRPSLVVPPTRTPMLPSDHSKSKSSSVGLETPVCCFRWDS